MISLILLLIALFVMLASTAQPLEPLPLLIALLVHTQPGVRLIVAIVKSVSIALMKALLKPKKNNNYVMLVHIVQD
jgi:hypothetical protein